MTEEQEQKVERIVGELVGLGRLWARTGLEAGRRALEASATSLGTTARLLGELAETIDGKAAAQADDEAPAAALEPTA